MGYFYLTRFGGSWPFKAAIIFSAANLLIAFRASKVPLAI